MKFRALAVMLMLGVGLAGLAQAKKPKPVNHRVSASKAKPHKMKIRKFKQPKSKHPKHRA